MVGGRIRTAVIGASGYTGADLVRLAVRHPNVEIVALTANSHAGKPMAQVYPHLAGFGLPDLVRNEEVDWSGVDAAFCGLPHGTSQDVIATLPEHVKVIDISADFRLRDPQTYAEWYGLEHVAQDLLKEAVYGLTEHYRDEIRNARLVACPGCYPTATLILLLPLVESGVISTDDLIIDAKSGVSGAGRGLKQNTLFCEAGEGMGPYAVGRHRHAPEIEQELSRAAGQSVVVNFTPHLIPMSRGEFITAHAKLADGATAADCERVLAERYADEPFVRVREKPVDIKSVAGTNFCDIYAQRNGTSLFIASAIDNLLRGASSQAVVNANILCGFDESLGIPILACVP